MFCHILINNRTYQSKLHIYFLTIVHRSDQSVYEPIHQILIRLHCTISLVLPF
ncbi:hypothetical protein M153_3600001039 [Pseudoloma neurophilia]|uniref:Uncharacterized protein n=1 Tax=Pseudoloma neurophilia TaxID=146866 RepID=A0A0R0M3S7_9MICR|nr:hypothetical protein M153_3600001039 [Pseudoloma neurophilia]